MTSHICLLTQKEKNLPVEARNYKFSEKLCRYVRALEVENKAIYRRWADEPFYKFETDDKENRLKIIKNDGANLVAEAVEYFFLRELSTHLEDYFNKIESNYIDTVTLEREDLSRFLINNRFLDLFSKPAKDRELFSDQDLRENVVFASSNDAIFERFELTLPKGASVQRTKDNKIFIRSERVEIDAVIEFGGSQRAVPFEFCKYYLGLEYLDLNAYELSIKINIKFPFSSLLTFRGWEAYYWVDSFFDTIKDEFDFDEFLMRINWDSICAAFHLNRGWIEQASSSSDRQEGHTLAIEKTQVKD